MLTSRFCVINGQFRRGDTGECVGASFSDEIRVLFSVCFMNKLWGLSE
ncbi:hypothetical protein HMPREF9999_01003 [Alloprevotella sp. oral taxon 473 str. F0040]|nr:hypothetical protein HMPREF9999_01003 [Alloprevotella sp. oral taxon 473 str. F0040]